MKKVIEAEQEMCNVKFIIYFQNDKENSTVYCILFLLFPTTTPDVTTYMSLFYHFFNFCSYIIFSNKFLL